MARGGGEVRDDVLESSGYQCVAGCGVVGRGEVGHGVVGRGGVGRGEEVRGGGVRGEVDHGDGGDVILRYPSCFEVLFLGREI